MKRLVALLVVALMAANAVAQNREPSPRAPPDISAFRWPEQLKALDEAMKPYVEQARSTFPAVKARYLAGLKKGEVLFVTARLYDERTWSELVFIRVTAIQGDIIEGRVWSKPKLVTTHGFRDRFGFPENLLIDWSITGPDGAEEGNLLGKSLKLPK